MTKYIKVHPLFLIFMVLSILSGLFKEVIIILSIIVIHELGHFLFAYIFKWNIDEIEILPFGGVAKINEYGNTLLIEDFVVLIMGPLFQCILWIVVYIFYKYGLIFNTTYDIFLNYHLSILVFNLLPIWPLDGGKLIFILLNLKFPFKTSHKFMIYISYIIFIIIFVFVINLKMTYNIIAIGLFIIFKITNELRNHEFIFNRFLLERYLNKNPKISKIKTIKANNNGVYNILKKLYKNYDHIIINRNNIYREKELLKKLYKEQHIDNT